MRYDIEIKNKAIEYYLVGYSANQVSKIVGVNEATIRKWIKEKNIEVRNGGSYNKKYDEEFVKYIWELYESGLNTTEITNKLGLKRGIVSYLLRENSYKMNHRGPKSMIGREDYFDRIDSFDKAYYLGWIMADGNVSITNGQYSLKIHIAIKDKELIDNFLSTIQSTNKTKVRNGKNTSYYVSLTSRHMCESLMNYGIIPHKTGLEVFPKDITKEYYRDFIRGVFDGDGITDISKKRSGFVGSYNLVNSILSILNYKEIRIFKTKSENIFYFLGGKKFSKFLFQYMYEDRELYLTRKFERMKYICEN